MFRCGGKRGKMDKDKVLKSNEAGGENLSDVEKITAELNDFIKTAKGREDYEEWQEYNVPVELTDKVAPVLKDLEKTAVDYSFDEIGSKYIDDLDGFLGVDIDEEDFYDFESGRVDDDAYNDAKYTSRLQKINALGEDEHFGGYGFAEGFNLFNVKYDVDGGESKSDKTLTYTRDILGDRKSVPTFMTTGLAELLIEKLKEEGAGAETLAKMPSFEEHMAEKEKNREVEEPYEDATIHGIAENLGIDENRLKKAIAEGKDDGVLGEAATKVREKFNENFVDSGYDSWKNKEYFVLDVLSGIHDEWCKKNEAAFFDPEQSDKRYRFLDFSMIGFEDAAGYLKFATPILERIGVEINDENLHKQYDDYPLIIDNEDGERLLDALYGYYTLDLREDELEPVEGDDVGGAYYLAEALYRRPSLYLSHGVSEKIKKTIGEDFEIAAEMTMQVAEHRDREDEADYGSLWAYHKRGAEGLYDYWIGFYDPFEEPKSDDEEEDDDENDDPYFTSQEYINDGWD